MIIIYNIHWFLNEDEVRFLSEQILQTLIYERICILMINNESYSLDSSVWPRGKPRRVDIWSVFANSIGEYIWIYIYIFYHNFAKSNERTRSENELVWTISNEIYKFSFCTCAFFFVWIFFNWTKNKIINIYDKKRR